MPDDLVLLGVVPEIEARIWRDALEQESIPVFTRPADQLAPARAAPTSGEMQVYVRREDARRARWVVGETTESDMTHDETAGD